jgi:hypothetical protein
VSARLPGYALKRLTNGFALSLHGSRAYIFLDSLLLDPDPIRSDTRSVAHLHTYMPSPRYPIRTATYLTNVYIRARDGGCGEVPCIVLETSCRPRWRASRKEEVA